MKNRHFIIIIVTVILLGFLLIWYAGRPKPETVVRARPAVQSTTENQQLVQRDATLYFASEDGDSLVSESRQLGCAGEEGCVQAVIEALVSGPIQEGGAVLPPRTEVLGVRIDEGTAVLDFSAEISSGHPGGSQSELLTVYSLANSVAVNFPHLRQVSILVNGEGVETLKGHVDLRRPLIADFTFARQAASNRLSTTPVDESPVKDGQ